MEPLNRSKSKIKQEIIAKGDDLLAIKGEEANDYISTS
jgi:hypothetical protein